MADVGELSSLAWLLPLLRLFIPGVYGMLVTNHSRARARNSLYDPRQVFVTRCATRDRAYGPRNIFARGN